MTDMPENLLPVLFIDHAGPLPGPTSPAELGGRSIVQRQQRCQRHIVDSPVAVECWSRTVVVYFCSTCEMGDSSTKE
jgi:hypothetical protein